MGKSYLELVIIWFLPVWLLIFILINIAVPINGWLPVFFQDLVFQSWIDNDKSLFDVFIVDGYKYTLMVVIIVCIFVGLFKVKH